jgi:hypothetical protein
VFERWFEAGLASASFMLLSQPGDEEHSFQPGGAKALMTSSLLYL